MNHDEQFPPVLKAMPGKKQLVLRMIPMPPDMNLHENVIFGGWIMSQIDLAGFVMARTVTKNRDFVTVAVNPMLFKNPIKVGDVVSFYAEIKKIGRTSITIDVTVYAWQDDFEVAPTLVSEATITYVAVDKNQKPRPIVSE